MGSSNGGIESSKCQHAALRAYVSDIAQCGLVSMATVDPLAPVERKQGRLIVI
jgi:hypothetical protein